MYDEIVPKKIKENDYWIDSQDILQQIKIEYKQWLEAVEWKRKEREDDLRNKYVPITRDDKVNVHSIYTTVQTLMSVYYSDKMLVEFYPRSKNLAEKAAQINKLAEFDYDEMWLSKLDYEWHWDSFFFWVWIKIIDWWDKVRQTPIARIVSPLCWIPDPRGWFDITSHRWAWFEVESTKWIMKKNKSFFNVDLVNDASENKQNEIYQAYQTWRWIMTEYVDPTPNKKFPIYNHYTMIDWCKYLVTTANHNTLIIRMIKLDAVFSEEKEDASNIIYPIALKYYSPVKWDPLWVSVWDLLRDKQSAESKLFNLTLISATRNALWDDKVYNPKKIKNIKDLQTPTVWGKYIAANINDWETLGSVIMTVPKENPSQLPFDLQSNLRFQSSLSTWLDSNSLWIQGAWNQTATEAQITQKNANLRFILWTKISKWWEEIFWKLWYRAYVYNLKWKHTKPIRITKWFDTKYYEIWRKDFITKEDVDIKIISVSEKESLQDKQKMDFFSIAPQFLSDPELPKLSKLYIKRKMYRLAWLEEEEVMRLVPKSLDERLAELDVELINANEEASDIIPWQDHLTFIDIIETADDNKYKAEALAKRHQAYIDEGMWVLQQQPTEWDNTNANIAQSNASSRMASNMMKESQENRTPSLQDLI